MLAHQPANLLDRRVDMLIDRLCARVCMNTVPRTDGRRELLSATSGWRRAARLRSNLDAKSRR